MYLLDWVLFFVKDTTRNNKDFFLIVCHFFLTWHEYKLDNYNEYTSFLIEKKHKMNKKHKFIYKKNDKKAILNMWIRNQQLDGISVDSDKRFSFLFKQNDLKNINNFLKNQKLFKIKSLLKRIALFFSKITDSKFEKLHFNINNFLLLESIQKGKNKIDKVFLVSYYIFVMCGATFLGNDQKFSGSVLNCLCIEGDVTKLFRFKNEIFKMKFIRDGNNYNINLEKKNKLMGTMIMDNDQLMTFELISKEEQISKMKKLFENINPVYKKIIKIEKRNSKIEIEKI